MALTSLFVSMQGLLWLLRMYTDANCADYRWVYDCAGPSPRQLVTAVNQLETQRQEQLQGQPQVMLAASVWLLRQVPYQTCNRPMSLHLLYICSTHYDLGTIKPCVVMEWLSAAQPSMALLMAADISPAAMAASKKST